MGGCSPHPMLWNGFSPDPGRIGILGVCFQHPHPHPPLPLALIGVLFPTGSRQLGPYLQWQYPSILLRVTESS